jgi:tRNA A-37 threonylcarbamoyl transferase component Bud32
VNLLQSRVASGEIDKARAQLDELPTVLQNSSDRLHVLSLIESARISKICKELDSAEAILEQAQALLPQGADTFEQIEIAHARVEILLCKGKLSDAESVVEKVVSRYATDDLAGREILARFLQARIFDGLGKSEQAERTLAAALRRALARGLSGYVDEARSRIASRGASQGTWRVGDVPNTVPPLDVNSRFVRRRVVGTGGFGTVARAYDLELGVEVALKRTRLGDIYDNSTRERLLRASQTEVAAASRVEHPGVARVLGLLIELHGDAYLIQEFIEGPTLRTLMATPIERPRALEILSRIAFALAAIHAAGVVHRDVKPENIVLRTGDAPVLVDFGIAQIAGKKQMSIKSGTLSYMSPEQFSGTGIDERSDLYSLGLIACELLIRNRPSGCFGADFVERLSRRGGVGHALIEDGIPSTGAKLIDWLVSKSRLWRPRSATAVAKVFAEASRYVSPKV